MSTRATSELTTTSYAILGLLAIQPWSSYEIAKQWDRNLGRLWPRARSKLYEEPKKLVAHGLARATEASVGNRARTVYTITPNGRRALAGWLAEPGHGPAIEFEQLLKVFLADQGTSHDVRDQLVAARTWAREQRAIHAAVASSYLANQGPFPERAPILALTGRFLADFAEMVGTWSEWALAVVEEWPEDPRSAPPDWTTFEEIAGRGRDEA